MSTFFGQSPHREFIQSPHKWRDGGTLRQAACGALNVAAWMYHHGWTSAADLWGGSYRWDYGDAAPGAYSPLGGLGAPAPFDSASLSGPLGLNGYLSRPRIFDAEGGVHDGGSDCTAGENRWLGLRYTMRALYQPTTELKDVIIIASKSRYTGEILSLVVTVDGGEVRRYELDEASGDVTTDDTDDVVPGHPYDINDFYLPGYAQVASEPFGAFVELSINPSGAGYSAREPSRDGGAGFNYSASLELTDGWSKGDAYEAAIEMAEEINFELPLQQATINGSLQQLRLNTNINVRWAGGSLGKPLTKIIASAHYAGWTDDVPDFSPLTYADFGTGHEHWLQYFGNFGQIYTPDGTNGALWDVRRCLIRDNYVPSCLRSWVYEYCYTTLDVTNPLFPLTVPNYAARWVVEPGTETSCEQEGVDCVRRFTTGEGSFILEPSDCLSDFGLGQLELNCHAHTAGSICCYNTTEINDPDAYLEPYPLGHPCYEP